MFSYRHAFHAGNHADVLKHAVLIATLKHLLLKPTPITLIDTHAGAGLYRLDGDYAQKGAEKQDGVDKLMQRWRPMADTKIPAGPMTNPAKSRSDAVATAQSKPPADQGASIIQAAQNPHRRTHDQSLAPVTSNAGSLSPMLADYLDLIEQFNPDGRLRVYPGSPFVTHAVLQAQDRWTEGRDRLKLFEWHPTDSKNLLGNIAQLDAQRSISVTRGNGFEALKTLLPPPASSTGSKRALILIDPSYELKSDYAAVADTVQDALKRFANGSFLIWYPLIARTEAHDLPRRLKTLARQSGRPWLNVSLNIGAAPAAPNQSAFSPTGLSPAHNASAHDDYSRPAQAERKGLLASGMFVINPPHNLAANLKQAGPQLLAALGRGKGKEFLIEVG